MVKSQTPQWFTTSAMVFTLCLIILHAGLQFYTFFDNFEFRAPIFMILWLFHCGGNFELWVLLVIFFLVRWTYDTVLGSTDHHSTTILIPPNTPEFQRLAPELFLQVASKDQSSELDTFLSERGIEVLPLMSVETVISKQPAEL